jgi:hypothetical protein
MGGMSEERVITIAATDSGHDASWSPAQEALFRVHSRIVEGDHEGDLPAGNASARLLVYSQQVRAAEGVRGRGTTGDGKTEHTTAGGVWAGWACGVHTASRVPRPCWEKAFETLRTAVKKSRIS